MRIEITGPLHLVHHWHGCPEADPAAAFTFETNGLKVKGENLMAQMQVGSYATVSVEWKDKGGNTVKVDGPTKWESSDPKICKVEVAAGNPQIANLYAPGGIGAVKIEATADADLGEGTKAVTAILDVEVISGQAVGGEIKFTQSPAQAPQGASTGALPPRK
jgi:hypothetical protein